MNIEGAVKLGYRKELMAIEDPEARRLEFERRTGIAYESAKAVNAAAGGGIDDVIDPARHPRLDRQQSAAVGLRAPVRATKKYPYIDPW